MQRLSLAPPWHLSHRTAPFEGIAVSSNFTVTAATLTTEQRAEVLEAGTQSDGTQEVHGTQEG